MVQHFTKILLAFVLLVGVSFTSFAAEQNTQTKNAKPQNTKIEEAVLGMNVSGTKDLPNVLYIVPWKSNSGQVAPPKITRLVDEIYAPVDPEVFAKQVKFYHQLTDKPNKAEK